jgi:hypothetical protein
LFDPEAVAPGAVVGALKALAPTKGSAPFSSKLFFEDSDCESVAREDCSSPERLSTLFECEDTFSFNFAISADAAESSSSLALNASVSDFFSTKFLVMDSSKLA